MTVEECLANINSCIEEIEKNEQKIREKEQECKDELQALKKTEDVSLSTTQATSSSYTLLDINRNPINPQTHYEDGTIFIYNGVEYNYDSKYGAFVKTKEPLCTKENVYKYMVPKSILSKLNTNVLVEFCKDGIYGNEKMSNLFPSSYKSRDTYLVTSKDGELPISGIYNINHGVNKVQFELNQYWAGNEEKIGEPLGENRYASAPSGCLLFSLINSLNIIDAKEDYSSENVFNFLKNNVIKVISPIAEGKIKVRINDIDKINEIAKAAEIDINYNGSKTKQEDLNHQTAYIARSDKGERNGQLKTSGGHYVLLIPAGDGNCYVIDSNNSLTREAKREYQRYYTPYMTYEEAKKSLYGKSSQNPNIVWEVVRG